MLKPDVDIDVKTDFDPRKVFDLGTRASMVQNGELKPHPCGYYLSSIPADPLTGLAAIPYDRAEELGFIKLDFLHNSVYDHFQSREEIETLLELEPSWKLLEDPAVVSALFQLSNHAELVARVKPTSIDDLADLLALIRPGKRDFINAYIANRDAIRPLLYSDTGGYSFKKSHAYAYALVIVLQLHLIEAGIIQVDSKTARETDGHLIA